MQCRRFCIALPFECYETDYVCSITHPDNVSTTLSVREMENISLPATPSGNIKIHSLETINFPLIPLPMKRTSLFLTMDYGRQRLRFRGFKTPPLQNRFIPYLGKVRSDKSADERTKLFITFELNSINP